MFMCRRQLPQAGKLIKMSKLQWGWCKSLWLWQQQQLSGREGGREKCQGDTYKTGDDSSVIVVFSSVFFPYSVPNTFLLCQFHR